MPLPYFEVNVPMRSTAQTGVHGLHVFTGRADSRSSALRIAHEVYDAVRAATEVGREVPHGRPDGWGACGFRPGWELDWTAATAGRWANLCRSTEPSNLEL
ncbi:hypothetical protein [Streptomyces albipurpureus]|uniref:Uncharacterized protein n=1 Tax=Streptomyces albipurpureus TaxID=2897419 RepID=A0ABT0UVY0_9ACTN|nr:hypothetical protein [Streptomyces sp. CWNU-1]MCM2392609.1 hypothetical protein [Streptomyces sp. CWNU-1]